MTDLELFDDKLCKIQNAIWEEVDKVEELVLDHNQMLADTFVMLRRKVATEPIGFNVLPEKFTLPQLQSLYEAIYQTNLDRRDFRKKILEMKENIVVNSFFMDNDLILKYKTIRNKEADIQMSFSTNLHISSVLYYFNRPLT